jgi:ABC-type multidrug transport system fused ATPase/permease subunit
MRFYSITHGSIEIDGENIEDFTLESYREKF